MTEPTEVKTMRLRYPGACSGCDCALDAGVRAHYLKVSKTARCLDCGPRVDADAPPSIMAAPLAVAPPADVAAVPTHAPVPFTQRPAARAGVCTDCGRRLRAGDEVVAEPDGTPVMCVECLTLDTLHTLGVAGAGARVEHAKRLDRHQTRVRAAHPRLGGVLLALQDEPNHVRAWKTGAVGEEEFGQRLSGIACETVKVLHDRKIPRSAANIDHLAVTSEAVWVLDAKRYKGRVETRGHGLFSRRPPDLFVGGRNQTKLVEGVKKQVGVVQAALADVCARHDLPALPVRGGLVFVNAEFGLFSSRFSSTRCGSGGVRQFASGWWSSRRGHCPWRRSRSASHASCEPRRANGAPELVSSDQVSRSCATTMPWSLPASMASL